MRFQLTNQRKQALISITCPDSIAEFIINYLNDLEKVNLERTAKNIEISSNKMKMQQLNKIELNNNNSSSCCIVL